MLGKCKEFDGDAIKQLVTYELGCSWALQLPHDCIEKDVYVRALDMRSDALGGRLRAAAVAKYIFADGKINWGAVGVFSPPINDDRLNLFSAVLFFWA